MAFLNKYKRWVPMLRIDTKNQLDLVLSQNNSPTESFNGHLTTKSLYSYIDINDDECIVEDNITIGSKIDNRLCEHGKINLYDMFLTALDNGFLNIQEFDEQGRSAGELSNEEYYNLLNDIVNFNKNAYEQEQEATFSIDENDCRLYLTRVTGNTGFFTYTLSHEHEILESEKQLSYYKLLGGFFQGFYKLYNMDYQVLPQYIDNSWNLEFVIRPQNKYKQDKDYNEHELLNTTHDDTDGIFFYLGTRAENKFAQFYKNDWDKYEKRGVINDCDTVYGDYFKYGTKHTHDYVKNDKDISDWELTSTSDGNPFTLQKYLEIITNNKYLLFNRTENGYTTKTFPGDFDESGNTIEYVLTGETREYGVNPYLLFNRTKHGYTTKNIEDYNYEPITENGVTITPCESLTTYITKNDFINNAFALRIKDYDEATGSYKIGYRYLISDKNAEDGWIIKEEYSEHNVVKDGEWSTISVKLQILNGELDNCGNPSYGRRNMRLFFYVNGQLKFISSQLPEFLFHELNDLYVKQEGVPYSISLGGGTQGLAESILTDRYYLFPYVLPIEKYFAGTFIGDFMSFKFYDEKLTFSQIKNNNTFEKNNITNGY